MATNQQFLVCDSSTAANFRSWGSAVSARFTAAGWVQATDSGQVNWTTTTVPAANAFVYEIWKPGDGLTAFYLKVEYGNLATTNCPNFRLSVGTSTNGAGVLSGFATPTLQGYNSSYTPASASTTYECDFCYTSSKFGALMWRTTASTLGQQFFGVQRSLDSSGNETGDYVTLWVVGGNSGTAFQQATLHFTKGVPPVLEVSAYSSTGNWLRANPFRSCNGTLIGSGTSAFDNGIPVDFAAPCVGKWDNECTLVGVALGVDIVEGLTFTLSVYGVTKTYMPTKVGGFSAIGGGGTASSFCMEYD